MFKYENVAYSQMLVTAARGSYHSVHPLLLKIGLLSLDAFKFHISRAFLLLLLALFFLSPKR